VTDDLLLSQQILEEMYVALQAEQVEAICRMHTSEALARLSEIAQTADDPQLRSEAVALLAKMSARLREDGQDISRWSIEPQGNKPN